MMLKQFANELAQNDKIAATVAAATTGSGTATMFEWIPADVGKLATVAGILLSIVLIYTHWRKGRIEYRKIKMEIDVLAEKERERLERAQRRREQGEPVRRADDNGLSESHRSSVRDANSVDGSTVRNIDGSNHP